MFRLGLFETIRCGGCVSLWLDVTIQWKLATERRENDPLV